MAELPVVHHDEVDGVPTWWTDSDLPSLSASLVFRRGLADETLTTSGWSHLLEHLALHGQWPADVYVNGSTDLLYTSFDVAGPPDRVGETLTEIVRRLTHVDPGHVAHEARVLRAESATRPIGAVGESLLYRYGAQGPGLAGYSEPGLGRATASGLLDVARQVFTRGNAALALDGPIPATLALDLPAGPLLPTGTPASLPGQEQRAYGQQRPGLCLTGEVTRSSAATTLVRILGRRLDGRLRHEQGVAYSPWVDYVPVAAELALVVAGTDVAQGRLAQARYAVLDTLHQLATDGPTSTEVAEDLANSLRAYDDPRLHRTHGWSLARQHLLGLEGDSVAELKVEAAAVTAEKVRRCAAQVKEQCLLGVPAGTTQAEAGLPLMAPADDVRGYRDVPEWTSFSPLPGVGGARVVVAPEAAALRGSSDALVFRYDTVAGILAWPDGARMIVREDGYGMTIEPTRLRQGLNCVGMIDATAPPQLFLPQNPRPPEAVPRPPAPMAAARDRLSTLFLACFRPFGAVLMMINIFGIARLVLSSQPNSAVALLLLEALAVGIGVGGWLPAAYLLDRRRTRQLVRQTESWRGSWPPPGSARRPRWLTPDLAAAAEEISPGCRA